MNAELESLAQTILQAYQRYVPLEGNSNEQHTSRPTPLDCHSWVSPLFQKLLIIAAPDLENLPQPTHSLIA